VLLPCHHRSQDRQKPSAYWILPSLTFPPPSAVSTPLVFFVVLRGLATSCLCLRSCPRRTVHLRWSTSMISREIHVVFPGKHRNPHHGHSAPTSLQRLLRESLRVFELNPYPRPQPDQLRESRSALVNIVAFPRNPPLIAWSRSCPAWHRSAGIPASRPRPRGPLVSRFAFHVSRFRAVNIADYALRRAIIFLRSAAYCSGVSSPWSSSASICGKVSSESPEPQEPLVWRTILSCAA